MFIFFYFLSALATCLCFCNSEFPLNNDTSIECDVLTEIDSGVVCGRIRSAEDNVKYASFRGIPFAEQPVGPRRFMPLQPATSWPGVLVATEDGPICPQYDEVYGRLARPKGMSEACIFINVHVPLCDSDTGSKGACHETNLPIYVFAHGGGYEAGSGNSDMHGPEYLCHERVIVITFNYRLNFFGFLSLNSTKIPGNNGLRDAISALNWVHRNARAFGGDPDNITLGGHSCGSVLVHLLSLSEAAKGLFQRLILMSGTAIGGFYTASPKYAAEVSAMFLEELGVTSTDPEKIHDQLVQMPLEDLMEANRIMQFKTGTITFCPVVESQHEGVTRILDDYPENLIKQGRGKDLPMIIGFTSKECEFFRRRIKYLGLPDLINENNEIALPSEIKYSVPQGELKYLATVNFDKYFKGGATVDKFIKYCSDSYFKYAAFKVAKLRAALGGAPVHLYQFSFDGDFSPLKLALTLNYEGGGGHVEDLTFMFRTNSMMDPDEKSFPPRSRDDLMRQWMTQIVVNFMRCSHPLCEHKCAWPAVDPQRLNFHHLREPVLKHDHSNMTDELRDMYQYFEDLYEMARNQSTSST